MSPALICSVQTSIQPFGIEVNQYPMRLCINSRRRPAGCDRLGIAEGAGDLGEWFVAIDDNGIDAEEPSSTMGSRKQAIGLSIYSLRTWQKGQLPGGSLLSCRPSMTWLCHTGTMEKRRDKLTALYIDAVLNGERGFEPSRCLQALLDVGISRITAERLVAQEKVRRRSPAASLSPAE